MENNIIVIGAGATGLYAASTLARAGKNVTVLEARDRTGGRIHTLHNSGLKTDLGAEFVHGNLLVTLNLLKQAGIATQQFTPQMWRYVSGKFRQEAEQMEGWDEVMDKLNKLDADMPIVAFMQQYFAGDKYKAVIQSVLQFVAGYDTADPARASAFALRKEWQSEDEDAQHHIPDGYCAMINYLTDDIARYGGNIKLNSIVQHIHHQTGQVKVVAADGAEYIADKVIIALPLGVLQAGVIQFHPPLPQQTNAFNQIGFGAIIKILLQFDAPFWERADNAHITEPSYLFSEEKIPTWWTQEKGNPLLTGWLGGNAARDRINNTDEELLEISLQSVSKLFNIDLSALKAKLINAHLANWTADKFARGSYAYDMVGSDNAREILNKPVNDTIYFAGEYLYNGSAMGTVEAALNSALKTTELIVKP